MKQPVNVKVSGRDPKQLETIVVRPDFYGTIVICSVAIFAVVTVFNSDSRNRALFIAVAGILLLFAVGRFINKTKFLLLDGHLRVEHGPLTVFRSKQSFALPEIAQLSVVRTYESNANDNTLRPKYRLELLTTDGESHIVLRGQSKNCTAWLESSLQEQVRIRRSQKRSKARRRK